MRRVLLAAMAGLLIVALDTAAMAQGSKLAVGPMIGLDFATWGGSDAGGVGSRTGYVAGGFLSVPLGQLFWIRPEAYFAQKGWEQVEQGVTVTFKTDYIEVPVLVGLTIPVQGSGIRPVIYAGPSISFSLGCKVSGEQGGTSVDIDCDDPQITNILGEPIQITGTDFGILFGGGLGFPVGPGQLALGVRYNVGLSKILDVTGSPDVKNRALSITAEFGFPIGR